MGKRQKLSSMARLIAKSDCDYGLLVRSRYGPKMGTTGSYSKAHRQRNDGSLLSAPFSSHDGGLRTPGSRPSTVEPGSLK